MHTRKQVQGSDKLLAFTLIEILVVIAIIGILFALLIPTLSSAKSRARTVACVSNMRQFGTAFSLYCQDNQDKVPPNKDGLDVKLGDTWVEGWQGHAGSDCTNINLLKESLLYAYVHNVKVWSCPFYKDPKVYERVLPRVRTVSLNCFIGPPWKRQDATIYMRSSQINDASKIITFIDEKVDTVNDATFAQQFDYNVYRPDQWTLRDKPGIEHGKGGNFSFADGHVETHRWKDQRTLNPPRDDAVMAGNEDILWLQEHMTVRPQ